MRIKGLLQKALNTRAIRPRTQVQVDELATTYLILADALEEAGWTVSADVYRREAARVKEIGPTKFTWYTRAYYG